MSGLDRLTGIVEFRDSAGAVEFDFDPVLAAVPGYELADFAEQGVQRVRDVAESPYVDNEVEVSSRRGAIKLRVVITCAGSTPSGARTLRDAVLTVAERRVWRLRFVRGGVTDYYECRAADWSTRETTGLLLNFRTELTLTIPVARRL